MQGVVDQGKLNPDQDQDQDQDSYSETKQRQLQFFRSNNDTEYEDVNKDEVIKNGDDDEEEEEEEEEFSFMCGADYNSPIAAEDAFVSGQIKPVFPLFNMDSYELVKPAVKKVFVERNDDRGEIIGPYCEWSGSGRKAVQVEMSSSSSDVCKKSNSTGFSKIWRFKDLTGRSSSDGKDAFVFLNKDYNVERRKDPTVEIGGKAKKASKSKMSAHEVYLRSKAKEEERRRYRPELLGFFTNVNGGLSKNVHPF